MPPEDYFGRGLSFRAKLFLLPRSYAAKHPAVDAWRCPTRRRLSTCVSPAVARFGFNVVVGAAWLLVARSGAVRECRAVVVVTGNARAGARAVVAPLTAVFSGEVSGLRHDFARQGASYSPCDGACCSPHGPVGPPIGAHAAPAPNTPRATTPTAAPAPTSFLSLSSIQFSC